MKQTPNVRVFRAPPPVLEQLAGWLEERSWTRWRWSRSPARTRGGSGTSSCNLSISTARPVTWEPRCATCWFPTTVCWARWASPPRTSALTLAAQDAYIGWDADLRSRQLRRVLALGHFLVRPPVDCRNLSSKALGCACGACPTTSSGATATTSCWWKPLSTKTVTRAPRWSPTPALGPGDGLARAEWNEHEFGSAPLSNRRWRKRLIQSARIQSEASAKSFLAAARKDQAAVHVGR